MSSISTEVLVSPLGVGLRVKINFWDAEWKDNTDLMQGKDLVNGSVNELFICKGYAIAVWILETEHSSPSWCSNRLILQQPTHSAFFQI